jgi:hypothetical protein
MICFQIQSLRIKKPWSAYERTVFCFPNYHNIAHLAMMKFNMKNMMDKLETSYFYPEYNFTLIEELRSHLTILSQRHHVVN